MRLIHICDFVGVFAGAPAPVTRPFGGQEGVGYAEGTGRFTGELLSGSARWTNTPHRRGDGAMQPDMRGMIATDDGATVLFTFTGLTLWEESPTGMVGNQLFFVTFVADDERYTWLNRAVCVLEGRLDSVIAQGHGTQVPSHIYRLANDVLF